MNVEELEVEALKLDPKSRAKLAERLLVSLDELSEQECAQLDQRLDELDREGPTGIPWDEVMQRIRSRAA